MQKYEGDVVPKMSRVDIEGSVEGVSLEINKILTPINDFPAVVRCCYIKQFSSMEGGTKERILRT